MEKKDIKPENKALNEKELEKVNGGLLTMLFSSGIVSDNADSYSSGSEPKYRVGEELTIKYKIAFDNTYDCTCVVLGVSSNKNAGMFCREYTYTVRITQVPEEVAKSDNAIVGATYSGVFESCLYTK